jgi:hypothetical protein
MYGRNERTPLVGIGSWGLGVNQPVWGHGDVYVDCRTNRLLIFILPCIRIQHAHRLRLTLSPPSFSYPPPPHTHVHTAPGQYWLMSHPTLATDPSLPLTAACHTQGRPVRNVRKKEGRKEGTGLGLRALIPFHLYHPSLTPQPPPCGPSSHPVNDNRPPLPHTNKSSIPPPPFSQHTHHKRRIPGLPLPLPRPNRNTRDAPSRLWGPGRQHSGR